MPTSYRVIHLLQHSFPHSYIFSLIQIQVWIIFLPLPLLSFSLYAHIRHCISYLFFLYSIHLTNYLFHVSSYYTVDNSIVSSPKSLSYMFPSHLCCCVVDAFKSCLAGNVLHWSNSIAQVRTLYRYTTLYRGSLNYITLHFDALRCKYSNIQ